MLSNVDPFLLAMSIAMKRLEDMQRRAREDRRDEVLRRQLDELRAEFLSAMTQAEQARSGAAGTHQDRPARALSEAFTGRMGAALVGLEAASAEAGRALRNDLADAFAAEEELTLVIGPRAHRVRLAGALVPQPEERREPFAM